MGRTQFRRRLRLTGEFVNTWRLLGSNLYAAGTTSDASTRRFTLSFGYPSGGRVRLMTLAALLALSSTLLSQSPSTSLDVNFTASAEAFRAATEEYRDIWVKEGNRIVAAME